MNDAKINVTKEYVTSLRNRSYSTRDTGHISIPKWMEDWDAIYEVGGVVHTAIADAQTVRDILSLLIGRPEDLSDEQYISRIRTEMCIENAQWIEIKLLFPFPHWITFYTTRHAHSEIFMIGGTENNQKRWRTWGDREREVEAESTTKEIIPEWLPAKSLPREIK